MLRRRQGTLTDTGRAEAFSDGVFAVAITLLALDLGRIHGDAKGHLSLWASLTVEWPTLLAFAGSFVFIGVAWTNHHQLYHRVKHHSKALNWANLLLLASVTIIPWVTSVLAEALGRSEGDHGRQEVLLYALAVTLGTLSWALIYHILVRHPELLEDPQTASGFAKDRRVSLMGLILPLVAALVGSLWSPLLATALFFVPLLFYAVFSEGIEG